MPADRDSVPGKRTEPPVIGFWRTHGPQPWPAVLATCLAALLTCVLHALADDELRSGFLDPPASARPGVYWYFMDGHLSREGMTADLESMREAGIGYVVFLEVNVGVPRGQVDFLSEPWQELFVHAVREAERLGIQLTLGSGPGWAGSGGPWVQPEQSMQHLVAATVEVTGPQQFDQVLARPAAREPYFPGAVTGLLQEQREAFYEDVAVLAFPALTGEERIADSDEKALYYRAPFTSRPHVKPYLPAPADHPDVSRESIIPADSVRDITQLLRDDGRLEWDVPPGKWTVMRLGRRNNGATTRPAPQPGLGFECDKLDAAALDAHFAAYAGKLLAKVGPRKADCGWTMMHIDSWEMGAQNWTPHLRQEFLRRRGYDLLPYLPTYTGRVVGSVAHSERFLWDLRLTAQELVLENHAGRLKQLARQHGMQLSIEPYDMNPTSDLELGAVADVPMCEFWSEGFGFDSSYSCVEATSVAHTNGCSLVAAEAFTADRREAWQLYPAAIKNQGDWAFCAGINHFVYHTFAHKPLGRFPGMTMGPYGVHWDRGQTWWPLAPDYHRYIARCQFMLRQGTPVADICYLVPEGAPHVFLPPSSALEGTGSIRDRRGYNFDGCSPITLLHKAQAVDGRIVFPGGTSYRVLVLPATGTMTPELLEKIKTLVAQGATVIGSPPRKSPSLVGYPACDDKVSSLANAVWGQLLPPAAITTCRFGQGQVLWGGDLVAAEAELYPGYEAVARILLQTGLPPDFASNGPIRYVHRQTPDSDCYFVSNRTSEQVETECVFRVADRQPELWDPVTGTIRELPTFVAEPGRTRVPLRFEPHQSFFLVFRRPPASTRPDAGRPNFVDWDIAAALPGPWQVSFDTSRGGPASVAFPRLQDWTRHADPAVQYYSGIATYRQTFDLPADLQRHQGPLRLSLGTVHCLARVCLNGQDLGTVWCAPWSVPVDSVVRPTGNELEIDVANLWPNRLIGDQRLPAEQRVTWTTFNPYRADSPLLPAGLLGPVHLWKTQHSPLHRIDARSPQGLRALFRYDGQPLPVLSAHRGGARPGLPENCLATFEHTLRHTFSLLEIDLQSTKDGHIVLLHDPTLERTTTGTGRVIDRTLQELRGLRLKDVDGHITDHSIPTLDEALQWARGKTVVILDKKDVPVDVCVRKILDHRAEAYAMVMAYSFDDVRTCHQLSPDIMMEVMIGNSQRLKGFEETSVPWDRVIAFIGHTPPEDKALVQQLHDRGVCCMAGTSRNLDRRLLVAGEADLGALRRDYQARLDFGVDIIEADLPVEVAQLLYGTAAVPAAKSHFLHRPGTE